MSRRSEEPVPKKARQQVAAHVICMVSHALLCPRPSEGSAPQLSGRDWGASPKDHGVMNAD